MNDPLDQKLTAAVLALKNRLDAGMINQTTNFSPPRYYKVDAPSVKKLDIRSIFTGKGMPDLTEGDQEPPRFGGFFDSSLTLIEPGTVGQEDLGNVPPTPAPPAPPDTVSIVFADVASTGCLDFSNVTTLLINGTFTLTFNPSDFAYEYTIPGGLILTEYTDVDCTVSSTSDTHDILIQATLAGSTWTVTANADAIEVFSGSGVAGTPMANTISGGNVSGGTATITT